MAALVPFAATLLVAWGGGGLHATGYETVAAEDLLEHVGYLAAPELEGRDTPSEGLRRAAAYAVRHLKEAGFEDLEGKTGGLLWTYVQSSAYGGAFALPVPDECRLVVERAGDTPEVFAYGTDFVPVHGGGGEARAEAMFLGFGIDSEKHSYNDLKGRSWRGKIAVILEGEPRHRKLFGGETVTEEADLYWKIDELEDRGAKGVLCIRRPPPAPKVERSVVPKPAPLAFRHTWASFVGHPPPRVRAFEIPVLEITPEAAERIFEQDLLELAEKIDRRGKPERLELEDVVLDVASATTTGTLEVQNVVGVLRGSDPELADEYVVIGAHYDHLGVDPRGRIGLGADDNASGVATVLELAEALGAARPRRSVIVALFAGEEDGLHGSRALCANPPVPAEDMVAMVNMDMLGRGEPDEILLLGLQQNPELEDLVERAEKLAKTGVKKLITNRGQDLYQRSDHYAFHELGVPALFFYEGWPTTENEDYHTFDDTVDRLDITKIRNSARLLYNVVWLLANDDSRPPRPR